MNNDAYKVIRVNCSGVYTQGVLLFF